jgi:hypothetical protein
MANTVSSLERVDMSTTIQHEIEIDAPPSAVWAVLADTASYGDWNPFVRRLAGDLREGAKLKARVEPPGGHGMSFRPTVLAAEPERELRWLGRLLVPGVFDGEHRFQLEPLAGDRTRFVQSERFTGFLASGFLLGLLKGTLEKTRLGFEQMNQALKVRAEAL